ncbi:hypothetical protein O6H91_16G047900 [Diphasiastrum complanatum]|uniref:Uncharacterized protein n=1 Tax=Diphasiastrum complanatum TaxID=34168 RepID=A0ACC2BD06_DIPCM|nr:hypothetical protein O6H91_16G047900 [Diphasiastrum complanatum]
MASAVLWAGALWSFVLFTPIFFLLFMIGSCKALVAGPLALITIITGNASIVIGLWPAFVIWTYGSIVKTKKLGLSLKVISLLCVPVPLILWPITVVIGSILVGFGYGFFTPLIATFEAFGEGKEDKLYNCLTDGVWGTIKGSCTVVRDFADWCYHSFSAYLADFSENSPKNGQPYNIRFLDVPRCLLVGLLGLLVDVPAVSVLAVAKSPLMLLKGWQRFLHSFITRDGACSKVVCVPFAGLAIVFWPLVVIAAVISAILSSFILGLFGAVIVHQESSFRCGLAYIVAIIAEFDEYTNDVLYLQEGSCLPRPGYRKQVVTSEIMASNTVSRSIFSTSYKFEKPRMVDRQLSGSGQAGSSSQRSNSDGQSEQGNPHFQVSLSLKKTIQEVKMVQIWDHMFETCQIHGESLVKEGVITRSDIQEWVHSSKNAQSKLIGVGLPAYTVMKNLVNSAKSGSTGLVLLDGSEVTVFNRPQDRLVDWFFEPLLVLKEQIKAAQLQLSEERYLEKLVLSLGDPGQLEFWQNGGVQPEDNIKKGELQAIARRIQGIVTSASRFPTFRRRYQHFIKALLLVAQTREKSPLIHDEFGGSSDATNAETSDGTKDAEHSPKGDDAV